MNQKRQNATVFVLGILIVGLLLEPCESLTLTKKYASTRRPNQHTLSIVTSRSVLTTRLAAVSSTNERTEATATSSSIRTYDYDGWTLTYRYKPASPGYESQSPLLLIHPVGIGLASWFWENFMREWQGPAVYAPDLIGCGVKHGGSPYNPDERGLSFPLGWVQGCEALMNEVAANNPVSSVLNALPIPRLGFGGGSWNVVCQGGLAPVGVMLAARNPTTVSSLVLTSPPTYKEMTTPIPESELERNYNFLRNEFVEPIAFGLLETQWAIEYFSNLFLFSKECDQQWLDSCCNEIDVKSRPPVQVFNAGFCNHRSFQQELESLPQPTLILSGNDDKRVSGRVEYQTKMKDCTLQSLPGQNVLPWESPGQVCEAVKNFCYSR